MTRFAGADPGFSGAIALLTEDGRDIERVWPVITYLNYSPSEMKKKDPKKRKSTKLLDVKAMAIMFSELDSYSNVFLALETVSPRGNDAATVAWKLGGSYMAMLQALQYTSISVVNKEICTPSHWKKIYPELNGIGGGIEDRRLRMNIVDDKTIESVQELFPNSWQKICPPHKSRAGVFNAPNPNWADAVLLANYAKHCYEGSLIDSAKVA